jgi:small subunit ribosomal protein S13
LARIAGVDLPRNKRIEVALTYIFGIGHTSARKIIKISGVNPDIRVNKLTDDQIASLRSVIEQNYKVEGSLRTEINMNIKRLIDIGSYRGLRHRRGLPVRGQRSKTNARTRKGPKKTIGRKKKA